MGAPRRPQDVNDELAAEFDEAVDSCAMGYAFATAERGRLVTTVPGSDAGDVPLDDAGLAPSDAGVRDVPFNPDVPTIPLPDGMSMPGDDVLAADVPAVSPAVRAEGGCACSTKGASRCAVGPLRVGRRRVLSPRPPPCDEGARSVIGLRRV